MPLKINWFERLHSLFSASINVMNYFQAIDLVEKGERLSRPESCSPEVYKTMEKCWAYNARDRPTFRQLVKEFTSHTNYENVRQLILQTDIV